MVLYYSENTEFKFNHRRVCSKWLKQVALLESKTLGYINVIFCSDPYILELNRSFLGHNFYTDIITFDYCEGDILSGDLFISVDTVLSNSQFYHTIFFDELNRVIVHGLLHLIGYNDSTDDEVSLMREKENFYLDLLNNLIN